MSQAPRESSTSLNSQPNSGRKKKKTVGNPCARSRVPPCRRGSQPANAIPKNIRRSDEKKSGHNPPINQSYQPQTPRFRTHPRRFKQRFSHQKKQHSKRTHGEEFENEAQHQNGGKHRKHQKLRPHRTELAQIREGHQSRKPCRGRDKQRHTGRHRTRKSSQLFLQSGAEEKRC